MEKSMNTGYAVIVIGLVIIMFTAASASLGFQLAVKNATAFLSVGGFIVALGFLTAGFQSTEGNIVRVGLIALGGATILVLTSLL